MLSAYVNYPRCKISVHKDASCNRIRARDKAKQRVIHIDRSNVDTELSKLAVRNLKFASVAELNDIWIHINLEDISSEESLIRTIQEIIGKSYKRLARAKIVTHCAYPGDLKPDSEDCAHSFTKPFHYLVIRSKAAISSRQEKIEAIIETITSRIANFNSLYRGGPSLYFYKRIVELRKKHTRILDFFSDNYNFEVLYATLVYWDMNSRGAKLKYFDDFKSVLRSCLPQFEAIESAMQSFSPTQSHYIIELLRRTYEGMTLMETSGRLVSNSKCLHFLFPSLCIPMDRTNTLKFLFGNTNESINRYLEAIQFSFDIMRMDIQFEKYLDNQWNQTVPKLIDNAIILLSGKSLRKPSRI